MLVSKAILVIMVTFPSHETMKEIVPSMSICTEAKKTLIEEFKLNGVRATMFCIPSEG